MIFQRMSAGIFFISFLMCMVSTTKAGSVGQGQSQRAKCKPGVVTNFVRQFKTRLTGYYPHRSRMEGGYTDRKGVPLKTLQDYVNGRTAYVSVAMDHRDTRFPYGTKLRIPAIERDFGRCIEFRVVDTGGLFLGKKTAKLDVCNKTRRDTLGDHTNRRAEVYVVR